MEPKDIEYSRTGPLPAIADEIADLVGNWQRALAAALRAEFPDYAFVLMAAVKALEQSPDAEPGTVITFLPNDPTLIVMFGEEVAESIAQMRADPRGE